MKKFKPFQKHLNQFETYDKASINNILYFPSKYFKRTFQKQLHEIISIEYVLGMKYLLNAVQYVQYIAHKY